MTATTATKPPTDTALPKGMTLRDWFAGQALAGADVGTWDRDSEAMIAARRNDE